MKRRQQIINANAAKSHDQWQRSLQWSWAPGLFIMPFPSAVSCPPVTQSTCYHLLAGAVRLQEPQVGSLVRLALSPQAPCPPPLPRGVVWNEATVCRPPRIRDRKQGLGVCLPSQISFVLLCCSLSWPPYLPFLSFPSIFSTCLHMPWMFWTRPRFLGHPKWVSRHCWLSSATLAAQIQPPAFADLVQGNWRGKVGNKSSHRPCGRISGLLTASFGPRQPAPCSPVCSRPRWISMGYLGGQQQLGTGPFSAAGGKGTLVGVLPLTLLPAPRTCVPCAYQPTRKNNKSPQGLWQSSWGFWLLLAWCLPNSRLLALPLHPWPFGLWVPI